MKRWLALWLASIYATLMYGLIAVASPVCQSICPLQYRSVIDLSATSPYRYRLLAAALVRLLIGANPSDTAILHGYILAHLLIWPLALLAVYAALRRWLNDRQAVVGVALLLLYLPLMYRVYYTSLYNPIELGLLSAALAWRKPGLIYALLVALAALNRETGLLLVLAFFVLSNQRRWLLIYALIWFSVFIGLRLWLGSAPDQVTLSAALRSNLSPERLRDTLISNLLFLPLVAACFWRWNRLPHDLRRLLIGVAIPYLVLVSIFGYWNEVRLWMPLLPLLFPVVLGYRKSAVKKNKPFVKPEQLMYH